MKLRNILGRDGFRTSYLDKKSGGIHYGNYYVNDILKIGALTREGKRVVLKLLPTYNLGETITLKPQKNIIGYRVIFYGQLSIDENIHLIRKSYNKKCASKSEIINFWVAHAKELEELFGKEQFEQFLLNTSFELGKIPYQFEILYKGKVVEDISSLKEEWDNNKKSFELLTYIK